MEDIMKVMKGPEMTLPTEGKVAFIQRENEKEKKKIISDKSPFNQN